MGGCLCGCACDLGWVLGEKGTGSPASSRVNLDFFFGCCVVGCCCCREAEQ